MSKIVFLHHFYIALRSRSKVRVKVTGQGQRAWSNFWRTAVDIRGSALPSATKSNNYHYQSKVIVCVSVTSGRMRIVARMRSIGKNTAGKLLNWNLKICREGMRPYWRICGNCTQICKLPRELDLPVFCFPNLHFAPHFIMHYHWSLSWLTFFQHSAFSTGNWAISFYWMIQDIMAILAYKGKWHIGM